MKIAVIGTGNVGSVLGKRWATSGHQVVFGSRDPNSTKVRDLVQAAGENAGAATIDEAAAEAEVVVLATPWAGTEQALQAAGDLAGKVLVDCTNPLVPDNSGLVIGHTSSGGEQVAAWAPGAQVVKAFNSTGSANMADPDYNGQSLTMFICGDDAEAKANVAELAADLDFDAIDAGPLLATRYLESLAMLWIHLAYRQGLGPDIGFKLLQR